MARKSIPKQTETAVLIKSRRRCSICFGLDRDTRLKAGQIAHLDRDNQNTDEDNLCFLCFEHHDQYDSKSSQRKNLTKDEVKAFRAELLTAIHQDFSVKVHFGQISLPRGDPYAGQFIRVNCGNDSAEIQITPLPDNLEGTPRYYVYGLAFWGTDRLYGPNIGELSQLVSMSKPGEFWGHDYTFKRDEPYKLEMKFDGDQLTVKEKNWTGLYGMNVTFEGEYRRT
jgi:hypothetical protein